MSERRANVRFNGKYEGDFMRIDALAMKHGLSRAEVIRRGVRFAIRWNKKSLWERFKLCFLVW